ncbi:MAG TPA: sugar phosphate isomerase/epimerase family protein [Burkholderiales bacterium]|jgi:sugar phosphate isomerase/epimerase|nr:sugar phosphate isomerase/epimerase family protein [Burkholderiales bacterium]
MKLRDRIGIDISRRLKLEDAIEWAAKNELRHIDIQLDVGENALPKFDTKRCAGVRKLLDKHGIGLGLHSNSAVNVAEYSPIVSDAVTDYLKRYVDMVPKLGASWTEMHAGYHFTRDKERRMAAGRERLKRVVEYAGKKKALVLLENLNKEPADAEVHYLAHTVEEWQYYWDIKAPNFRLCFTVNHAHLVPEGMEGFIEALNFKRVGEVRLADTWRNGYEIHLAPGKGDMDFGTMFKLIEGKGYRGYYTNAFADLDVMLAGRDYLVEKARAAGVKVD